MTPQHDHDIDQILSSLGKADPPIGMQSRILAAIAQQEVKPAPAAPWWTPWRTAALASACVVLLVSAAVLHRSAKPSQPVAHLPATASPRVTASPVTVSAMPGPRPQHHPTRIRATPAADAQTIASTTNIPAPPEPLTSQERLLIRLIHRNDPVELSMLTTAAIHASNEQEKSNVRAFFAPQDVVPVPDTPQTTLPTGAMQ